MGRFSGLKYFHLMKGSQMRPSYLLILFIFILSIQSGARASSLRTGGMAGVGDSVVNTDENLVRTEGPISYSFFLEYSFDSRLTLAAEHVRSLDLSPVSTGISMTGLHGKYYFYTPHPQNLKPQLGLRSTVNVIQKSWSPYVGTGIGFSQSSVLPRTDEETAAASAGLYIKASFGVEYPLWGKWGLRSELSYGTSVVGTGQVQMLNWLWGIYAYL